MEFDEKHKRQMIRVIITEVCMVLAVIAIVVVSMMAAMGFMISGNGSIEQTGLLQLHTLPTGASVKIDGAAVFGRTNLSRTLSAGEHSLEIYRDGYDTWQNTIKVRSGVLVRLYYPRLFLVNRMAETVKNLNEKSRLDFFEPSPRRNFALMAEKEASEWQVLDLRGDEVKSTSLDMSKVLPGMIEEKVGRKVVSEAESAKYKFAGKIEAIRWSNNEENVLVKVRYEEKSEWILVRLRDLTHSVNLSRTFGLSEEVRLEMIDSVASQIYVLEKRQLRRIDTSSNVMSRILIDNVMDFRNDETRVIYLTGTSDGKSRKVGVYRDDENGGTILAEVADDVDVKIALTNYYDDDYMLWTENQKVNILYGRLPSYDANRTNLDDLKNLVEGISLKVLPENLNVSPGGEYVVAKRGQEFMVIDLDDGELYEYEMTTDRLNWFDDSMMYVVEDNQIMVWDYDGKNWRNLSKDVKMKTLDTPVRVNNDSPVVVSANNKYIYYLTTNKLDDKENLYLTREQVRD